MPTRPSRTVYNALKISSPHANDDDEADDSGSESEDNISLMVEGDVRRSAVAAGQVSTMADCPSSWWLELKIIFAGGWALSLNLLLQFLPGIFAVAFIDNADELAGVSSGFFVANVVGFSLVVGFATGLTSLASQAIGAGNLNRAGDLLQRQILLHLVVVCLPVGILWFNALPLLTALGQPAEISALAAQFLKWRIPGLPFYTLQRDVEWFLQCAKAPVLPRTALYGTTAALNVFLYWFLISDGGLNLGFVGAPIAASLTNFVSGVSMLWLGKKLVPREAWPLWSFQAAVTGWGELLALSLPGTLMLCAEWWGNEASVFFAGYLCTAGGVESSNLSDENLPGLHGNNQPVAETTAVNIDTNATASAAGAAAAAAAAAAADVISCLPLDVFPLLLQTMVVCFMTHFGFSLAGGNHVGNLLGANLPARARIASLTLIVFVASIAAVEALTLVAFRPWWGYAFTSDERMIASFAESLPLVALQAVAGALGPGALSSLLRGAGVLRAPSVINVVAFWLVGIPLGLYLTFSEGWGQVGLWVGLDASGWCMVMGMGWYLLWVVDFEAVAAKAAQRAQQQA